MCCVSWGGGGGCIGSTCSPRRRATHQQQCGGSEDSGWKAHAEHNGRRSHTRQGRRLTNTGHALRYVRPSLSPLCLSRDSCSSSSFSPQHQRRWNGVRPQQSQLSHCSRTSLWSRTSLDEQPASSGCDIHMDRPLENIAPRESNRPTSEGSAAETPTPPPRTLCCLPRTS